MVLVEDHDDSRELLALMLEVLSRVGKLPAVAVTGYSDRDHPKQAREAGSRECLNKPVDPERLCGAVAKVLDRSG